MPEPPAADRNFDELAPRFQRKVYSTAKGELRLAVLRRDFAEALPRRPQRVVDVGGGQGQWAIELASLGHSVLLTDISSEMLGIAERAWAGTPSAERRGQLQLLQASLYSLPGRQVSYDLVTCHAVLEWLAQPEQGFRALLELLDPGGLLSLVVYNVNGLIMKNLLRGNYRKVAARDFSGAPGSLTPPHPISPEGMLGWIDAAGLELVCYSGIRVFNDYQLDVQTRLRNPEQALELELEYSRREPFRALGRYLHFLCRKPG